MSQQLERFLHDEHLDSLHESYDRDALLGARSATYVIHQDVTYRYSTPVADVRQRLMIVPRRHGDQAVLHCRFSVESAHGRHVRRRTDRFGNDIVHVRAPRVDESIRFTARAVVHRALHGCGEPDRQTGRIAVTRLTQPDAALGAAARAAAPSGCGRAIEVGAAISRHVFEAFTYRHDVTTVHTTAVEAWALRAGVCQDMAHVMIAMCATLGVPARYVSGHLLGDGASHAWVEVVDPDTGRAVAFDPTHDRRTDLRYITTAVGRDYRDVAPTGGTYVADTASGRLTVTKRIRLADLA